MRNRLILLIFCSVFLLTTSFIHTDAIPLPHPTTSETGYWISEGDMDAMLLALEKVDQLETQIEVVLTKNDEVVAEFNLLFDEYQNLKKKVGVLWGLSIGVTLGVITGLGSYLILKRVEK